MDDFTIDPEALETEGELTWGIWEEENQMEVMPSGMELE